MDIDLNEEQDMLRKMSRDYLKDRCPSALVREMMEDEKGYSPDLWKEITELGWLGLPFPTEYGGEGGSYLDLIVLLQEMGRAAFPGPYFSTVVLGGLPILYLGSDEQKKDFIPRICKGELIATLAQYEEEVRYDAAGITLKASPNGNGYTLSGTKMFVPDANLAGLIIVAARTSAEGIALFLVDRDAAGMDCTVLKPLDGSKQCRLIFNDVKVSSDRILGTMDKGWDALQKVLELAAIAKCADRTTHQRPCSVRSSHRFLSSRTTSLRRHDDRRRGDESGHLSGRMDALRERELPQRSRHGQRVVK